MTLRGELGGSMLLAERFYVALCLWKLFSVIAAGCEGGLYKRRAKVPQIYAGDKCFQSLRI